MPTHPCAVASGQKHKAFGHFFVCRYPYNLDFDFGALEGLNKFSINNLGDPFIESNYGVHSREFEVRYQPIYSSSLSVSARTRNSKHVSSSSHMQAQHALA